MHKTPEHTHTHTRSLSPTIAHTPTSPKRQQGIPAAIAHPLPPTPPGGGDVPEGTEVSGPILSSAGSHVTSTAPLLLLRLLGALSWVLGPGQRQAQTLQPLLGEQREALLSTACPPAPTAGSFSGLSSGCAGMWGRRGQGLAKGPTGPAQERVWQRWGPLRGSTDHGALAEARLHVLPRQFCSSFSRGPTRLDLLEQPGLRGYLLFPGVTLSAPKNAMGVVALGSSLVKMGGFYPERLGCSLGPQQVLGCTVPAAPVSNWVLRWDLSS